MPRGLIESLEASQSSFIDEPAFDQPTEVSPVVVAIVKQLVDDPVLAEATLQFIHQKKQAIMVAKLRQLYSDEQVETMLEKVT